MVDTEVIRINRGQLGVVIAVAIQIAWCVFQWTTSVRHLEHVVAMNQANVDRLVGEVHRLGKKIDELNVVNVLYRLEKLERAIEKMEGKTR